MEWIHHLKKATPPNTPPKMISLIQSSELKWETARRVRKCIIAKMKIISKDDICLTVTPQKRPNTYQKSISLGGVVALIVQIGNNKWLKRSAESVKQLPEGLSQGVHYLLGDEARSVIKNAKESIIPLNTPSAVPWTCDRCGKTYTCKLKLAKAHADADVCRAKSRSGLKFFVGPCKSITQKQSHASKRQTKWSDQVAKIAISRLHHRNSLHLLVSNPLCQNCFYIKDQLNTTSSPRTHLPCCACILSCLAPIAIDDMDTWTKIFAGGKKSNRAHASGQISWDTNIKSIFIAEAIKVYKSCTSSCRALKEIKSLLKKLEQQSVLHNGHSPRDCKGRTLHFIMAVNPFLFDMNNDQIKGTFKFKEVYPSSKTNLHGYLHLLQTFLTYSAKTKRTPTLSKRRWIVSALLHLLQSRDNTLNVINVNSFYARHAQAPKVTALRRPSSTQNISHCLPQLDGDEFSLVGATASPGPSSQLSPTTKTTSSPSSSACHSSKNGKHPFIIYTDGACQGNGKEDARAGVGVFYGRNDPRNISAPLKGKHQTNQRAELTALKSALEGIVNKPDSFACDSYDWNTTKKSKTSASATTRKKQVVIIKSDSNYCVTGFKTWLTIWKKKGWLNSKKEPVANRDLWRQVDKLNTRIALLSGLDVKVEWVRGHNGDHGNEEADKLAVDGIGKRRVDKSANTRSLHTRHLSNNN